MNKKRIIIIDDDVELCKELAEMLKTENFSVSYSSDGDKGEKFINEHDFDILLLDYKMTSETGFDILKKLKSKYIKKKVILISGRPFIDNMLKEEGLTDTISGIISKPINFRTLLKEINE